MYFKHQNGVHFDLDRALEPGNSYWAVQDWRKRMQIGIRQDLLDSGEKNYHTSVMEYLRFEIAYEDLIESLLLTIGTLQLRLAESNVRGGVKDAEAHVEKEGLT